MVTQKKKKKKMKFHMIYLSILAFIGVEKDAWQTEKIPICHLFLGHIGALNIIHSIESVGLTFYIYYTYVVWSKGASYNC